MGQLLLWGSFCYGLVFIEQLLLNSFLWTVFAAARLVRASFLLDVLIFAQIHQVFVGWALRGYA